MNTTHKILVAILATAIITSGITHFANKNTATESQKTYQRQNFSFQYPGKYIMDDNSLWTEDRYESHIDPMYGCETCQIPNIKISNWIKGDWYKESFGTLEEFIISDLSLDSSQTFQEMSDQIKIGNNNFIKIESDGKFEQTNYYTENDDQIVIFEVFDLHNDDQDNQELQDIISTLEFK